MTRSAGWICMLAGGAVISAGVALGAEEAEDTSTSLSSARSTLQRWVETQAILSRERRDWQQGKEILLSRIEAVKKEIDQLEERLKQSRTQAAEAGKAKAQILAERDAVTAVTSGLSRHVGELETKVRALFKAVPEPLKDKLLPLYQRMPEDPSAARVSLAERFQNVLGILNEMNRINSELTVATEIRPLSDGKPSEVRTVYVGLGQAYFVSAGGEAGVGMPSPDGWVWRSDGTLARDVTQVLEILQSKSSPKFVPLPVEIR